MNFILTLDLVVQIYKFIFKQTIQESKIKVYFCRMKIASEKEQEFILKNLNSDINKLLLQNHNEDIDIKFCVRQIEGYNKAKEKFASLIKNHNLLFPNKINLEQSSSGETAHYKASLLHKDSTLRDLTSGFGIDDIFFAKEIKKVYYHETDIELALIAEHNFKLLGINNIEISQGNSLNSFEELAETDIIYIDPSRRDANNNKVVLLKDSEPNIVAILPKLFEKAKKIYIKLSPMLDIKLAMQELINTKEVHIISVKNECKELLVVLERNYTNEVIFHCIDIIPNHISKFTFTQEKSISRFAEINLIKRGIFLYEPNASIMKAGGYHHISQAYQIDKLAPHSHLFISENEIEDFPGRSFIIKGVMQYNNKTIKNLSKCFPKANITTRNFPQTVAQIRERTKINEGSDEYLFFTTDNKSNRIIISCEKT
jgi:16S rRNA G966 N2-methylase RsmD